MKINLEKELEATSSGMLREVEEFNITKEVKLLLDNNQAEHKQVLANFSLDDSVKRVEASTGHILEVEDFKKSYGNAYTLKAIRALALKYRMQFLPLNRYAGAIDPYLAATLLEFGKKHGIDVTAPGAQDNFYLLAPNGDFKLEKEIHTTVIRNIISRDPLLFYRGITKANKNREGELWTLVHKWGTEFNYFRVLRSIPYRNKETLWISNAMAIAAVMLVATNILLGTYSWNFITLCIIAAVVGCLGSCIRSGNMDSAEEKNFFTESNWNDGRFHVNETVTEDVYV